MYQNAAAMNAYEQWQNNVGHNLANVSTAGYKKQSIAVHNDPMGRIPMQNASPFERMLMGASPEASNTTSFEQGTLQGTDKDTDLAIEGKGFFELQLPEGGTMLTRTGQFQLNSQGALVSAAGYPVLSPSGNPITLEIQTEESKEGIYINRLGEIYRGKDIVGAIGIKHVEDTSALTHRDGGFVLTGNSATRPALGGTEYSIHQGFIEGSNSSAMREMVQMVNLSRAYESSTRMVQAFDSRYGQTISQLSAT